MKRTFYRLITPDSFSNFDSENLVEVIKRKVEFGSTPENEHYEYWQEKMNQCGIVKVTEIIENFPYVRIEKFGIVMSCSNKHSNCQLCKYIHELQTSEVCSYCVKHNKENEYYMHD